MFAQLRFSTRARADSFPSDAVKAGARGRIQVARRSFWPPPAMPLIKFGILSGRTTCGGERHA